LTPNRLSVSVPDLSSPALPAVTMRVAARAEPDAEQTDAAPEMQTPQPWAVMARRHAAARVPKAAARATKAAWAPKAPELTASELSLRRSAVQAQVSAATQRPAVAAPQTAAAN